MPEYTKIIRQMRVFEFDAQTPSGSSFPLIAIDREDGLRERLETALGSKPIGECRPRNIGLMIDRNSRGTIVMNADNSGYASTEIMRILNLTGLRGELLFITNGKTYPLHLLRRLNKVALDFDLGTISMQNLIVRINDHPSSITQELNQRSELTSAVG